MGKTYSQTLRGRPGKVLELVKHVFGIETELCSKHRGARSQSEQCLGSSAMLRRKLREFFFEGFHDQTGRYHVQCFAARDQASQLMVVSST